MQGRLRDARPQARRPDSPARSNLPRANRRGSGGLADSRRKAGDVAHHDPNQRTALAKDHAGGDPIRAAGRCPHDPNPFPRFPSPAMTQPLYLLTGGAGFLGINLCRYLLTHGIAVRSLDIAPFDYPERDRVGAMLGDIRDAAMRERALDGVD